MEDKGKSGIISGMSERTSRVEDNAGKMLTDILRRVPEQLDVYAAYLEDDKDAVQRLGNMGRADLQRNINDLSTLRSLLEKWSSAPQAFGVSVREQKDTEQGVTLSLKLRKPGDPKDLPIGPEHAQKQLSVYLDFRAQTTVTKKEVIENMSFKGLSPQEVLERCRRFLPRDARFIINSVNAWVHPRTETIKIEPGAGLEFRFAGSQVVTHGVAYVGVTPLFTDDLSRGIIKPEEMVLLREQIKTLYPPKFR